jgi:hypothetical protein
LPEPQPAPTPDDAFPDEDTIRDRLIEFLAEKVQNPACPVCGTDDWVPGRELTKISEYTPNANQFYPIVARTCFNCGLVQLFNAVIVGLLPGRQQSESTSDES